MKIAYIAHPISGDIKGNLEKIRQIVREINMKEPNILPFAPYWVDCHALDDTIQKERERGIKNDCEFFVRKSFDELWLYGNNISNGMIEEVKLAHKMNIPVIGKTFVTSMWYFKIGKNL